MNNSPISKKNVINVVYTVSTFNKTSISEIIATTEILAKTTIKEQNIDEGSLEDWDEANKEFLSEKKEADNPLESGFDIPIL